MSFGFLLKYYKFFLSGTANTLMLSALTVVFGLVGGVVLSIMRTLHFKPAQKLAGAYIAFIRGTPLLVQLYIVYYGLKDIPMFAAGVVAMSINSSAYIAEIIRAGISAVDKGQLEATKSLGMTSAMAYTKVILPQAFKNILPALGNEFVILIKESAIVSVIGLHDLMYNVDTIRGITYKPFEPLLVAAAIYFVLTAVLSKGVESIERRLQVSD